MKKILLLSFYLFGVVLSHASANLQLDLELCYKNYSDAINHFDLPKIKMYMSEQRFTHVRNVVISQKLTFPEDFIIEACYELIRLNKAKFLFAEENGNTATCTYYGKGVHHLKSLIVISFLKEGKTWKYDGIKETSSHLIKSLIESNNLDSLKSACAPNGIIRPVEAEIENVTYKGWYNLQSHGYLVYIKINGIEQDVYNDDLRDGIVLGGLKNGKNNIEIDLLPMANVDKREIKISIRGFITDAERDVFNIYQLEGQTHISKDFEIKEYMSVY